MAFTYLVLNLVFMAAILFLFAKTANKPSSAWWITLGALLLLTVIFDNLIIAAGIVDYDTSKLMGLYIGVAPIEDFFYTVLAVILVPVLWRQFAPAQPHKERR